MRQKGILLAFVETMHFIHKQNSAQARQFILFGFFNGFTNFFNAAGDRRNTLHFRLNTLRNNFRQGGFAGTGGPPENHGMNIACLNRFTQRFTLAQQMRLATILRQGGWAHSGG